MSTSSNSSWTFSNSHDLPKPRKGRLCGIFLIGAVLVVALSVIAIGGLAFYIGGYSMEKHKINPEFQSKKDIDAKRQYSTVEITKRPTSKHPGKISATEESVETSTTDHQNQTKQIPAGTILGISKTMQELTKKLKEKKKEETTETTTETLEKSTELVSDTEEPVRPVVTQKNVEILPKNSGKGTESEGESFELDQFGDPKTEKMQNGHARPTYSATERTFTSTSTDPLTSLFSPKLDYSEEPWRPIVPSYREVIRMRNPYLSEKFSEKVPEHRYGSLVEPVMEDGSPITFSKDSFDRNLRITPDYARTDNHYMNRNEPNASLLREIVVTSKDPVRQRESVLSESEAKPVADDEIRHGSSHRQGTNVILVGENGTDSQRFVSAEDPNEAETRTGKPGEIGVDQIQSSIEIDTKPAGENLGTALKVEVEEITPEETTIKAVLNVAETEKSNRREILVEKNIDLKSEARSVGNGTVKPSAAAATEVAKEASSSPAKETPPPPLPPATTLQTDSRVVNPFLDDSRSSSNFNFGLPDLPILKQFHHLDNLFKSFSKPLAEAKKQIPKHSSGGEVVRETEAPITRFPVRKRQTTVKSYRDGELEASTIGHHQQTTERPTPRKPVAVIVRGDVEVVSEPVKRDPPKGPTTEIPKLITLLPVRSNVNMMRPLRPRPKSNASVTLNVAPDGRKSKMSVELDANESAAVTPRGPNGQQSAGDQSERLWLRHPSYRPRVGHSRESEKWQVATRKTETGQTEPPSGHEKFFNFTENLTTVPLYNTIESLLNQDHRRREGNGKNSARQKLETEMDEAKKNTSEIVERIVKIMENVAVSAGNSSQAIVKVNQTVLNKATTDLFGPKNTKESENGGFPAKVFSSQYKLNQAGLPILTRILNKVPPVAWKPKENGNGSEQATSNSSKSDCDTLECEKDTCLSASKKCNQFVDCPDAADEKNCTCADHLKSQKLDKKLCDGIVDCWDFSDEYDCDWCKNEFLCSNSKTCVKKSQICDGKNDCPLGVDERNCVTISPSRSEAETFNYHPVGYLMVRKNGKWGKLCIDNFESVSHRSKTGWKISDLGRSVCKALTFRDFDKVERLISSTNELRSSGDEEKFYELAYNDASNGGHSSRDSALSFHETDCEKKEVVKVTCTDLECGVRSQVTTQWSRIVGGGNAAPGSWPWQAALYKEGEFQCGGTLISENWLISAGHCFYNNQNSYWVARLGTLRTTLFLPSPYEQLRHISKIIVHPQYLENGFVNDISLLRMKDPVRFTDYVRPICLPKFQASIIDGTFCTIIGWGQLSEVGWVFPDTLQEVQLPILSTNECRKRTLFIPLYKITDDMFCASYERGGRDACMGDSGGPLMCTEPDGKWTLYGITSNGYGCGRSSRPGVYTKVSNYLHWINSQMSIQSDSPAVSGTVKKEKSDPSSRKSLSKNENWIEKKPEGNVQSKLDPSKHSEDNCEGLRCPLGECLPKSNLCDGRIQCSDASDEKDCW